jgi:hypothetical protein
MRCEQNLRSKTGGKQLPFLIARTVSSQSKPVCCRRAWSPRRQAIAVTLYLTATRHRDHPTNTSRRMIRS